MIENYTNYLGKTNIFVESARSSVIDDIYFPIVNMLYNMGNDINAFIFGSSGFNIAITLNTKIYYSLSNYEIINNISLYKLYEIIINNKNSNLLLIWTNIDIINKFFFADFNVFTQKDNELFDKIFINNRFTNITNIIVVNGDIKKIKPVIRYNAVVRRL
jgi:hypothetical protein